MRHGLVITVATSALLAAPAVSALDSHDAKSWKKAYEKSDLLKRDGDEFEVTDRALSGQEVLNADIDGPLGSGVADIRDVVLDERGEISYVTYETTRIRDLDKEGFMVVDKIEVSDDYAGSINITLPQNEETMQRAIDRRLSHSEAQHRLLSEILDGVVYLGPEGDGYDVDDVIFNRDGKAEFLVIDLNDGLFTEDSYAVPFDKAMFGADPIRFQYVEVKDLPKLDM